MNSSDIFSSQVFWIGLFVLIFACHGYAYWSMTKNINEGFREGQHNAPPLGAKKTNITTLKIPPTVLDTVAIPKALPASPF